MLTLANGLIARASPKVAALQQQLEQLNSRADRAVEQYLQAQLALKRTQAMMTGLERQAAATQRRLDQLRVTASAQAASAYVRGPGTDIAALLSSDTTHAIDRVQTLNLLAQRNGDLYSQLKFTEQAARERAAALDVTERQQAAQVAQLAARKAQIERLVARTKQLLTQLQAQERASARLQAQQRASASARTGASDGGVDPGLPVRSAPRPPSGSGGAAAAVRYAYAQLGKPYVWAAAGPNAFDCSGLTMMAWAQGGVSLPHSAAAQFNVGRHVSRAELQPGDLIYRYSPISHVAMYVGGGMQIAATDTGSTVKLQPAFQGDIVGFSRPNG